MPSPSATYGIVAARAGGACERACGGPAEQMHHRCARQMGGSSRSLWVNLPGNVVHICRACHEWATARPLEAQATGWVVRRGVAEQYGGAAAIPVTDLQGASRFLLNGGGTVPTVILHPEED